jgi:hypothetical protein
MRGDGLGATGLLARREGACGGQFVRMGDGLTGRLCVGQLAGWKYRGRRMPEGAQVREQGVFGIELLQQGGRRTRQRLIITLPGVASLGEVLRLARHRNAGGPLHEGDHVHGLPKQVLRLVEEAVQHMGEEALAVLSKHAQNLPDAGVGCA